jgi:hypothetical protein
MKKAILILLLISNYFHAQESQNQWIWVGGSKVAEENTYELGATSNENNINFPGSMNGSAYINDSENNIWFIKDDTELWMYNPLTNNFTFKKGINHTYGYNKGVGIEHYRNLPPKIKNRQIWIDNNDDIWCFSGKYWESSGNKSELWKYKKLTNSWTLIDAGAIEFTGNYGTIGVESSTNKPPVLENAITWTDNNNNLWMFGGHLLTTTEQTTNALWKYNISTGNWTWMSGSNLPYGINSFGPLGVESSNSIPGSTDSGKGGWVDSQGFLWLFDTTSGPLNNNNNGYTASTNIWKYNTNTNLWTLVKQLTNVETIATVGTEHANNSPSPISAYTKKGKAIWEDLNGNIWYYYNSGNFDKLWKFNPLTNMWTLVKQISNNSVTGPTIGTFNNSDINNTVGPRINGLTGISNNNKLLLLGGNYASETGNGFKDVWEYDISSNIWKWIKGYSLNDNSINAQKIIKFNGVIESENSPGFIDGYNAKWEYNGDLYLYGVYDIMFNSHNTLSITSGGKYFSKSIWKYHSNLKKWQVIHSFDERSLQSSNWNPVYNTKGVEDENNYPSIRLPLSPMSFADNNGNLYMFGGVHTYIAGYYFNDLWKFNISTNRWVWISGTSTSNQSGIYGTQGVPNDTNMPGSREKGKTWSDSQGNLWLFGGKGYASSTLSELNDLWKYDITSNQWTWVKGSNLTGQPEISAGLGISASNNTPPAIVNSLNWTDNSHNFWLYINGAMWKFDTVSNNWIKLTNPATQNYGSIGVTNPSNNPGSISGGTTWTDTDGNLLFYSQVLWKFDINTLMWTWVGGRRSGSQFTDSWKFGNYGQFNESFVSNLPGLRGNTVGWKDNNGNFFIYGGNGWDENSEGSLSDVWMMNRKFNTIFGNIKFDNNNDGCISSNINAQNVKINITDGASNSFVFTNNLGNYSILAQNSNVTITPQQNYFTFTPNTQSFSFSGFGATQSQNFCATSTGTSNDLEIIIIPLTESTPGSNSKYKITYKNNGNTTLSGNIVFNYDDNLMDYVSSTISPVSQSFGNINWNFSNLKPFEKRSIELTFNLNTPLESPPLNSGDQLIFGSIINSNTTDETPLDNNFTLNQTVVNSFDPNDKTCLNGNVVSTDKIGEYVYYKIRFENTGTANANHIVITDNIDLSKFDIESIMPVEASHNYWMSVKGNKVEFLFEYINLPFTPSNLRFGYVVFKIKTKSTLVAGNTFSNLANIYFDYNSPIITNNYTTTIQNTLGLQENELLNTISVYPNPVKDMLHFQTKEKVMKVEIYDVAGRIVSSKSIIENKINVSELKVGNYFLKVYTEKGIMHTKIIKE